MRHAEQVLLRPVVSEKSYSLMDGGVYVFVVASDASKTEIRSAVEEVFGVKVTKVNTLNRKGKAGVTAALTRSGTARTRTER